jgi:hypothetical protein
MKDFLFLYRAGIETMPVSPEEMQARMQMWMDWMGGIAAQNKLADRGNRLFTTGKVVQSDVVTDGPYTEIKEAILGYSIVKAESYDEAARLAEGCPTLGVGGKVEIREIAAM